jgi:hypothetical protein
MIEYFKIKWKGFKWVVFNPMKNSKRVSKIVAPLMISWDIQGEN